MRQTCPRCGRDLVIPDVALIDHQIPPWVCWPCGQHWWESELTVHARGAYRPLARDFYPIKAVWGPRKKEVDGAKTRGTSVHEGLLPRLTDGQLGILSERKRVSDEHKQAVQAEQARRAKQVEEGK